MFVSTTNAGVIKSNGVRVKTVALPVEHGGWGLLLEPIVLGFAVAPSIAGAFLALAAIGAFLARHPFKLCITDWRHGRRYPRTTLAARFIILYCIVSTIGLMAAINMATDNKFLLLLPAAVPLAVVQLIYDGKGQSRSLLPELAGSSAMAAIAASIALAGGLSSGLALGLWTVLAARAVTSILYVRARLSVLHGNPASPISVLNLHVAALAIVTALAYKQLVPRLAIVAILILLLRATYGLLKDHRPVTARYIGFYEIGYGALTVLALAIGYHFGL
jgi:hypothetical protein